MLRPETRHAVDAYWAGVFGCDAAGLRPSAPSVLPRADDAGSPRMYAMEFGAAPVALLPRGMMAVHAERVAAALSAGLSADPDEWRGIFGGDVKAVIGPATLMYADQQSFRPLPPADVRMLTQDDLPAAEALRHACAEAEWEHGGSDVPSDVTAGAWGDGELAALAGFEVWGGVLAHISVVAHPAHRGRGHAAAAVSHVTAWALELGLLAQYRTLESNTPSVALARRLGFHPCARSVAVRLGGA